MNLLYAAKGTYWVHAWVPCSILRFVLPVCLPPQGCQTSSELAIAKLTLQHFNIVPCQQGEYDMDAVGLCESSCAYICI